MKLSLAGSLLAEEEVARGSWWEERRKLPMRLGERLWEASTYRNLTSGWSFLLSATHPVPAMLRFTLIYIGPCTGPYLDWYKLAVPP